MHLCCDSSSGLHSHCSSAAWYFICLKNFYLESSSGLRRNCFRVATHYIFPYNFRCERRLALRRNWRARAALHFIFQLNLYCSSGLQFRTAQELLRSSSVLFFPHKISIVGAGLVGTRTAQGLQIKDAKTSEWDRKEHSCCPGCHYFPE